MYLYLHSLVVLGTINLYDFSLPKPVRLRARALKNIQVEQINLEAKFYEEVQQLEAKYQSLYQPLFDKVHVCTCMPTLYPQSYM